MYSSKFRLSSIILILLSVLPFTSKAQCTIVVESSFDYEVTVQLRLTGIVAPETCPWGYNFNIALDYTITIDGAEAPAGLYTLQGEIVCDAFPSNFFNLPNSEGSGSTVTSSNPYNPASDCAAVTADRLGCNIASIQIEGPGIPSQRIECTFGSPLPVTLLSFSAKQEDRNVVLGWITASETNNDYFTVEHSTDGVNWNRIDELKGAGNSSNVLTYETVDYTPPYGINYYRLKQTDFDGKFTYSDVQTVNISESNDGIYLYPNPTHQFLYVNSVNDLSDFLIFNAIGEQVSPAQTLFNGNGAIQLDVSNLPTGIYYFRTNNQVEKFSIN